MRLTVASRNERAGSHLRSGTGTASLIGGAAKPQATRSIGRMSLRCWPGLCSRRPHRSLTWGAEMANGCDGSIANVGKAVGCDRSGALLADAAASHPVTLCELPSLAWLQDRTLGTAFSVFVFDLVENIDILFAEVGRVVAPTGSLVVIINHPAFTAPGSGPFMDPDLDVFWQWGEYLDRGTSLVPAGPGAVAMYHRSTGDILTSARAGRVAPRRDDRGAPRRSHHRARTLLCGTGGHPRSSGCDGADDSRHSRDVPITMFSVYRIRSVLMTDHLVAFEYGTGRVWATSGLDQSPRSSRLCRKWT